MTFKLCALCGIGLERVVANELKKAGLSVRGDEARPGMVFLDADEAGVARAQLWSRCADRFILVMGEFPAADADQLYEGLRGLRWDMVARADNMVHIERVRLHGSKLNSVPATQSVAQKAICENLCSRYAVNKLGGLGGEVNVRLYIENDRCLAGVDLSGEALHRRGYRKVVGPAPLKETIAAGMIIQSGWKRKFPLLDPFCGSGTIPVEAALFAMNFAPGLCRGFAFRSMPFASDEAFRAERDRAVSMAHPEDEIDISASDIDEGAIEACRKNITLAGRQYRDLGIQGVENLEKRIRVSKRDMRELKAPENSEPGFIFANPPYGDRLGDLDEARALYRDMRHFRTDFPGWSISAITTWDGFEKDFGETSSGTKLARNGQDSAWIYHFGPEPRRFTGTTTRQTRGGQGR